MLLLLFFGMMKKQARRFVVSKENSQKLQLAWCSAAGFANRDMIYKWCVYMYISVRDHTCIVYIYIFTYYNIYITTWHYIYIYIL